MKKLWLCLVLSGMSASYAQSRLDVAFVHKPHGTTQAQCFQNKPEWRNLPSHIR
jgi:hypothetical protein